MDEQQKQEQEQQEIIDEIELELVEEFPVTEPTKVSEAEDDGGKSEAVVDKPEESKEDGGEVGKTISEEDKQEEENIVRPTDVPVKEEKPDTEIENPSTVEELPKGKEEIEENKENVPPPRTTEDLLAEIEDLKFEKETAQHIQNFQDVVTKQEKEYDEFTQVLQTEVIKQFDKYGIPLDADVDDLRETDPAKYNIMNNIIQNAKEVHDKVSEDLRRPIIEASENIVFRVAGREMKKYKLDADTAKEAATTFVNIMNEVGIRDLKDDIKGKVELAVARAKMLAKHTNEAVKETVKDIKEVKQEVKEVVKETGKKLEDYTKSVVANKTPSGPEVNSSNVMELYLSKKGNDRLSFFAEHKNLIMAQLKNKGLGYSDGAKRW